MAFKKIFEVAPQTSLDIAFGPLSEMLGNHCCSVMQKVYFLESLNLAFCCAGSVHGRFAAVGPGKSGAAVVVLTCTQQYN